jgi:hypothetical protein
LFQQITAILQGKFCDFMFKNNPALTCFTTLFLNECCFGGHFLKKISPENSNLSGPKPVTLHNVFQPAQ